MGSVFEEDLSVMSRYPPGGSSLLQIRAEYVQCLIDPNDFSFLGSEKDDSHVGLPPVVVTVLLFLCAPAVYQKPLGLQIPVQPLQVLLSKLIKPSHVQHLDTIEYYA